jgi:hypothetical protein
LLIGQNILQKRGYEVIEQRQQQATSQDDGALPMSDSEQEDFVIGMIEELRQMVSGNPIDGDSDNEINVVRRTAEQVQYEWREDDAVALYLLACRKILQQPASSNIADEPRPHGQKPEEDVQANENALLVEAVTPIVDSDPLVVNAVQVADFLDSDSPNNISSDDTILPTAQLIRSHNFEQDQQLSRPKVKADSHASFLPHIQMLPKCFPTSPLFYNADELARIEGTNCHGFCTRMLQQMESDWNRLQAVLNAYHDAPHRRMRHGHGPFANGGASTDGVIDDEVQCPCCCFLDPSRRDLEDYKWALCTIYSRSTDFFHDDDNHPDQKKHHRVIAPLLDMMNHEFGSDLSHFMDAQGNISVFNGFTRTLQPSDEIFLSYGNFPNEKLLLVYGFCVRDNPYDAVQIYAPIPRTDPLYHPKARLLQTRCGIDDVNAPHAIGLGNDEAGGILPPNLLSVLRVVGIQSAEEIVSIATATSEGPDDAQGFGMISVDNERSALSALGQALHSMARRIALNLISDEGLRGASNLAQALPAKRHLGTIADNVDETQQPLKDEKGSAHEQKQPDQQPQASYQGVSGDEGHPNVHNAKLLCISEYRILQAALAEISDRLNRLDDLGQMMQ